MRRHDRPGTLRLESWEVQGNNKTIKGVYVNTTNTNGGLFAKTVHGSIVKNFRFVDSYIYVNNDSAEAGSVAGYVAGTFENIYSNAVVTSTPNRAGGIVGRFQDGTLGTSISYAIDDANTGWIKQCWFDGSVTVNNTYLVITNSIGAGSITGGSTTVASILAGATGQTGLKLANVFATEESTGIEESTGAYIKQYLANIPTTVDKDGFVTGIAENDIQFNRNNSIWSVNINRDESVETITLGTCGR